jgi:membrane-bound ClpP family serine protease
LRENGVDVRNAILGLLAAGCLALVLSDASLFGIAVWKIVLAALGLALFVIGGRASGAAKR